MTIHIPATAFWCDAVVKKADPTGTLDIRKRLSSLLAQRFRKVSGLLRSNVVEHDVLGLKPGSVSPLALAGSSGNRELAFQTWLDNLLRAAVSENGQWMRPMLALSYSRAVRRAQRLTRSVVVPHDMAETIDVLATLAFTELQGICEAVSQRVMRSASSGWLHNAKPVEVFKEMGQAIASVGIVRSGAMAELMVVKSFTTGTLDTFVAAGVKQVGLIPETLKTKRRTTDARTGFGSRISREVQPSRSTIYRITKQEEEIEQDLEAEGDMVEVATAGDEDVCPECEDIEGNNPYSIDEARSLIPAHPRCRCAFVPVEEDGGGFFGRIGSFISSFFESATVFDYNENHDPKTGEFSEGSGVAMSGGKPISVTGGNGVQKYKVGVVRDALKLLPQDHLDAFKGEIILTNKDIERNAKIMGQFKLSDHSITLNTEFVSSIEETLLHEMGHAHDVSVPRVGGLTPSMALYKDAWAEAHSMTGAETKAAQYWLKSSPELYAEMYSLAFSRDHDTPRGANRPVRFFGGMSRARALSVFSKSVKTIRG